MLCSHQLMRPRRIISISVHCCCRCRSVDPLWPTVLHVEPAPSTLHLKIVQGTLCTTMSPVMDNCTWMVVQICHHLFESDFIGTHLWILQASRYVSRIRQPRTHLVKFATGPCIAQPWIQAPPSPHRATLEREKGGQPAMYASYYSENNSRIKTQVLTHHKNLISLPNH
jgi:hypothetical protein